MNACVSRVDGVVVDYAVTVVVNGAGVSNEQLDYLTLQLNRVENSYREVMEHPTLIYSISEVKDFGTEALHKAELESGKTTSRAELLNGIPCSLTQHTRHHYSYLSNWHGSEVTGNALAELVRTAQGRAPNVISNRDTVDPALILQHTLHHLRKHSRVFNSFICFLFVCSLCQRRQRRIYKTFFAQKWDVV